MTAEMKVPDFRRVEALAAVTIGHEDCQGIGDKGCHGVREGLASCKGTGRKYPDLRVECEDCVGKGGGPGSHPEYDPPWKCRHCDGIGWIDVEPRVAASILQDHLVTNVGSVEQAVGTLALFTVWVKRIDGELYAADADAGHDAILAIVMELEGLEVTDA